MTGLYHFHTRRIRIIIIIIKFPYRRQVTRNSDMEVLLNQLLLYPHRPGYIYTVLCLTSTPTSQSFLNKYYGDPWYSQLYNHKVLGTTSTPTPQSWVQSVLKRPYSTGFNRYNIHPVLGSTSTPTKQFWVKTVLSPHSFVRSSTPSTQFSNVTVLG